MLFMRKSIHCDYTPPHMAKAAQLYEGLARPGWIYRPLHPTFPGIQ
jgi:hypothetical protein